MLVGDARQAIKEDAPLDRVKSLTGELQDIYQALMARAAGPPPSGATGPGPGDSGSNGQGPPGDDDVIDADFTPN
jgi:molecular chaperone DnaK